MKRGPYYLWRYTLDKRPELVAIVMDKDMMLAWLDRRPAGEYRRAVRDDFGFFTCTG